MQGSHYGHFEFQSNSLWEWHIQHVHGVSHSWLGKKLMLLILHNYFGTFWIHCLLLLIDSFVLQNVNVNREFLALKSIQDLIVHRKNVSYNLRGDYILSLPKPKSTTYGLNSVRYIGPKLWNSILNMFRNITNFKSFKRSISQVDLVQFL